MKVPPIDHIDTIRPRGARRAMVGVRNFGTGGTEHTVIDSLTGERTVLPSSQAWELYRSLNIEV